MRLRILVAAMAIAAISSAQENATLSQAPKLPEILVDSDGTVHWGPRTIPLPPLVSAEAKAAYAHQFSSEVEAIHAKRGLGDQAFTARIAASKAAALKMYPVTSEDQKVGGVAVTLYTPQDLPAKNRDKIALEFEIEAEAIQVANFAHMKVMAVHYRGGGPSIPGNEDIVAVYRELLKTYQPRNIAMFGTSGGCTLAQTTVLWLPQQKLPMPGAVGLLTCSGGSNPGDSRITNNGLDPTLSSVVTGRAPVGGAGRSAAARKPTDPPATALDGDIPKGYPPAFLLSGTRDMCLSQTVLLHRKLRAAGVQADLNVFEGMWHAFHDNPTLPESREAMMALGQFFDTHLGK